MSRSAFARVSQLALLAAACISCSSNPPTSGSSDPPSRTEAEPTFDPLALGASIVCQRGSPEPTPFVFVLSALNHKLAHYPEFAAAAGLDTVTECEGANRFLVAYNEFQLAHPGFDANEPLGDTPDIDTTPPPIEPVDDPEVSKIAGVTGPSVNYPVVQLTYQTCKPVGGKPSCTAADSTWVVRGNDYRNWQEICSGTFISKNWILTAAHCMLWPAIDQCMKNGISLPNCKPNWNLYGTWRIRGAFRTGDLGADGIVSADDPHDNFDRNFTARGYIMKENWIITTPEVEHWAGTDLEKDDATCSNMPNCFNAQLIADHDLALLYIPPQYNDRLPPRPEDDGAKRLSIVNPPDVTHWQLAVAGWGDPNPNDPGARILRQTSGNLGTISAPFSGSRLEVVTTGAEFPCPGDSGGPVLRTGLSLRTNSGDRSNLDAIIAVNSVSNQLCDPSRPSPATRAWMATRVDIDLHRTFVTKTMQRWPDYKNFECVPRPIGTPPPPISDNEVAECWGKPCTGAGSQAEGSCEENEFCLSPGRLVASKNPACVVCAAFAAPFDSGCDCLQGQCLPLQP